MDITKNKVGYEINFTKYFYEYKPLRSLSEIGKDLLKLDEESGNINGSLNSAFQYYGKAFSAGKDKAKLTGIKYNSW